MPLPFIEKLEEKFDRFTCGNGFMTKREFSERCAKVIGSESFWRKIFSEYFDNSQQFGSCKFEGFLSGLVSLLLECDPATILAGETGDWDSTKKSLLEKLEFVWDAEIFSPVQKKEQTTEKLQKWQESLREAGSLKAEVLQQVLGLIALESFAESEEELEFQLFESQVGGHKVRQRETVLRL